MGGEPVMRRVTVKEDPLCGRIALHDDHGEEQDHQDDHHASPSGIQEAPLACVIPLCLTAAGSVAVFFYGQQVQELLKPLLGGAL